MRVTIAYNDPEPGPDDDLREFEANMALYDAVDNVEEACRDNGWEVSRVVVGTDPTVLVEAAKRADVVVNFIEAIGDDARLEAAAAWLLEWIGVPFTGSPGRALSLSLHKDTAKACLATAGVRVAPGCVLMDASDPIPELRYPLIVKPSREDASLGIEERSVVQDEAEARAQAARVINRFRQPVIVEEFIGGRDLTSALLTHGKAGGPPQVLPIREFDYTRLPSGMPRILTYDAKWNVDSPAFMGSPPVATEDLDDQTVERIATAALTAWEVVGLRDYARIDMRLPEDGLPVVIEVNPNPDLSSNAGFADTAAQIGIGYPELVRRIVEGALARGRTAARAEG
jgi:D-alanine-D-alanine ligase